MALSAGTKNIKTAVFISGKGSNLKSLIKFSKLKKSPITIEMIISNNYKSKGLIFGEIYKIKKKVFDFDKQDKAEENVLKILKKKNINLICLAGFMKILSKKIINSYKNKILNIHPSLLPKYKGLNTHKRVIKNNEKFTGCTVHLVNPKLDAGKIILQKKIKVYKKDNEYSLSKRVLKIENSIYPKAIRKFIGTNL